MTRSELIGRLKKYEWSDVEFKEARNAAPKAAYETVSAFANTAGGWLVFGVGDRGGTRRPDTNSVTPLLTNLSDDQRKIIALCEAPQKQAHLMRETGPSHRTFFRRKRLEPLIQAGLIRMTRPDEPNHPDQAYVVTEAAIPLLNAWRTDAGRKGDP